MNVLGRVVVGAALGAITTLIFHPASRSRLYSGLFNWGPSAVSQPGVELLSNIARLPEPKSIDDACLWMEAGALRILARQATSPKEWQSFVRTAQAGSALEPDNAFWPQMEAVFSLAMGDRARGWTRWRDAARRTRWDDGQTRRLESFAQRLQRSYGRASWVYIPAYDARTTNTARVIEWFARDLVRSTSLRGARDLELRYLTVVNGRLMREGARSIRVGEVALAIVELSSYPPDLLSITSPRKLLIARADLYHAIQGQKWDVRAEELDRAFRENDGWYGFPTAQEAETDARITGFWVLLANSSGTISLAIALLGVILAIIGGMLKRLDLSAKPRWLPLGAVALLISIPAWLLTDAWLPTALLATSVLSLLATPENIRRRAAVDAGYLHGFSLAVVGLGLSLALAVSVLIGTTPGYECLNSIPWITELLSNPEEAISVAIILLAIFIGMSPAFAWVHRFSTLQIITRSADRLGRALLIVGLTSAIVSAPLALVVERELGGRLAQLVNNEPVYYYVSD